MTSLVVWSTIWAFIIVVLAAGGVRQMEIYLTDEERQIKRDEIRQKMIDEIERINFIYPHEQVAWNDLTRELYL